MELRLTNQKGVTMTSLHYKLLKRYHQIHQTKMDHTVYTMMPEPFRIYNSEIHFANGTSFSIYTTEGFEYLQAALGVIIHFGFEEDFLYVE